MRSMKRRDLLRITGVGMLAGAVSAEAQQAHGQAGPPAQEKERLPNLRKLAKKVAPAEDVSAEDYFWLNDHTLLFLHLTPKTKNIFRAVLMDTITGQKSLPETFNRQNAALLRGREFGVGAGQHWDYFFDPPVVALSPDGRWLLWQTTFGEPELEWVCATLDGKQTRFKAAVDPANEGQLSGGTAYWLQDSSAWVEMPRRYTRKQKHYTLAQINVYRPDAIQPVKSTTIEEVEDGLPAGLLADGRFLLFQPPDGQGVQTKAVFTAIDPNAPEAKQERRTIPIPPTSLVEEVVLSPNGDRLAWLLMRKIDQEEVNTIYVSRSDGTQMRAVGAAPTIVRKGTPGFSLPEKLRWLPGGTQLSFRYDYAIHVLAV